MTRHFAPTELLAFLDGNDAVVDPVEVQRHIASCVECAARLSEVRKDYDLIADPEIWADMKGTETPPDATTFASMRRLMEEEARRAETMLAELKQHPIDTWIEHLSTTPRQATGALVQRVIAEARSIEEREPREALRLLDTAETMAGFVVDGRWNDEILGGLWKERANVLVIQGDYRGALFALDRAEQFFANSMVAPFDLAFVTWGRSAVYFEMGSYGRALTLIREATPVFRRFGDSLRGAQTQVLEAGILYEEGKIDEAHSLWESLLPAFEKHQDRMTLARVYANIACCHLQRYDLAETEAWARRATEIYGECGLETEITRTRWALAKVLLRRGDTDEGIVALERVAADFSGKGLHTDAAEVRLDIVEALLNREEFQKAAAIVRELIETFVRTESRISVVRAFASLREAAEGMLARPAMVRAVRHVLLHPDQPFTPTTES
jgi:tetratricopeptide (TPR) repeat protein